MVVERGGLSGPVAIDYGIGKSRDARIESISVRMRIQKSNVARPLVCIFLLLLPSSVNPPP